MTSQRPRVGNGQPYARVVVAAPGGVVSEPQFGNNEVDLIVAALPPLRGRGDEYLYASLPLCILDTVYNLGATYVTVQNLIRRYCERYGLPRYRPSVDLLPSRVEQTTVADLIAQIEEVGSERFARDVLRNVRPTSPHKSAVLRSEAALRMAHVLDAHGISVLQDIQGRSADVGLRRALRAVPGQGPSTGVANLFMLAGDTDLIKFDRMVKRFLERVLDRRVTARDAQALLSDVSTRLGTTAGHVDYTIWEYESGG